jgi:DNA-binding MarR family transcriptional regulator
VQVDHLSGDPLATRFFEVLIRMVKGSQHQAMAITAEYDLTLTQLRLLYLLDHATEPLPVSALGEAVGLSVAATGRAIDALHRSGLVSRNEDPVDRRIKRIALSEAGIDALDRITRARFAAVSDFVDALGAEERAALDGAVGTLAELAERHMPPPPAACPTTPSPSPSQETPA